VVTELHNAEQMLEDLSLDPTAEAWRLIRAISHNPTAMGAFQQVAEETGLPLAPLRALLVFPVEQPISMREIARRLGCDNSYVTSIVDVLEEKDLARRQQHPSDRRVKLIVLTEKGQKLTKRIQLADATPPPAFDALSKTEIGLLQKLLRKIESNST
jgi:DNA-binding MarR family transcriptional regulator